jgi:hypothetical protein
MRRIGERQSLIHLRRLVKSFSPGLRRLPRTARCDIGMLRSFLFAWTCSGAGARALPLPRVRGEGRGEGASPPGSDSRQRALTRIRRFARRSNLSPRAGRGEKSKSALAARARPSSADAKGKKALRHDPVRSGRRWDRRRHDHAQQNPIRRRMSICSPDEANGSGPKWPAR